VYTIQQIGKKNTVFYSRDLQKIQLIGSSTINVYGYKQGEVRK
jgi:hypothetical protein